MDADLCCPSCSNPLITLALDGVGIEICREGCGGLWFDRSELERVTPHRADALAPFVRGEVVKRLSSNRDLTLHCPKCPAERLIRIPVGFHVEVEIDECLLCGGVWLDRGELEIVKGRLLSEDEQVARRVAMSEALTAVKQAAGEGALTRLEARNQRDAYFLYFFERLLSLVRR